MTRELVRFSIVMLVILLGFAMSLHALFSGSGYTYGDAFLDLFRAMLGDLDLFETIKENDSGREDVATTLVVAYLVIMTIMMLNLLIAVLSTAHAKVHGNIDMEYRVSSARLMGHYVWAVKQHILPAPFNLVIFAVWYVCDCLRKLCGWNRCNEACNFTTKLINLVFFCPVVFAVGSLAWLVLLPVHLWKKCTSSRRDRRSLACVRKVLQHFTMDGPLFLGYLWVTRLVELLCPVACMRDFLVSAGCLKSTEKNSRSSHEDRDGGAEGDEGANHVVCSNGCMRAFCVRAGCSKSTGNSTSNRENGDGGTEGADQATVKNQKCAKTLAEMLRDSCENMGMEKIQDYVDNPFKDLNVQRGESTREATVEHMKRLGSYLEASLEKKMDAMSKRIEKQLDIIVARLPGV